MGITRPRPDGGVTRKAPGALPRRSPSPRGVKDIMVTQDTSSSLYCVAKDATSMFGRAKTGGLGQLTTQKMENNEKI